MAHWYNRNGWLVVKHQVTYLLYTADSFELQLEWIIVKASIGRVNAPLRPNAVIGRSEVYSFRLVGEKKDFVMDAQKG